MQIFKYLNRTGSLTVAVLALGLVGCAHHERTASGYWSDKMTTHRVKEALNHAPDYKYTAVSVSTFDGTVSLGGFVNLPEQKQTATEIASRVPGVRQVVDSIVIKPQPTGRAPVIEHPREINPGTMPDSTNNAATNPSTPPPK